MTQSFLPGSSRSDSPLSETASSSGEKHARAEDAQEAYVDYKNKLVDALDATKAILTNLRVFNKESWIVRYPQLKEHVEEPETTITETDVAKSVRRKNMRRSLSFADDSTFQADVIVTPARKGLARSVTLATIPDETSETETLVEDDQDRLVTPSEAHDFQIFRLDLKLGSHGSSSSPASLVQQLEKSSIANLVDDRISSAMAHIEKLQTRVNDISSKVLVTGDLNAGKSTFVNTLLRRQVMPVDQQPCTTAFCEVHDAAENDNKEEIHILKSGIEYSIADESSYTRASLDDLESFVSENENVEQMLKVYLADRRLPQESLLNNGIVDISLIDAPGLNRDSMKTTAVFARQEEIDVVVFVVSAENHFTLSAKEFLFTASNEKAYLFIVVNKYDQIRDKNKCRRLILDQVKQLSPRTYEDAEDLVHFVDSAAAFDKGSQSFDGLESSLRSFVLNKRSKSKLAPASTYLSHLLSDIDLLVGANTIVAQTELERAQEDLNRSRPVLEKLKRSRDTLEESLEGVEEASASRTRMRTKEMLSRALDRVGNGKLGVDQSVLRMPSYPGLLGLWDYAKEVRQILLTSLDFAVKLAEDEARLTTTEGVSKVSKLGEEHLPEGVERNRRVFMPEAMFSPRAGNRNSRRNSRRNTIVAGGVHGLGLGLTQRPDMLETTLYDILDVQHQFWLHFGDNDKLGEREDSSLTALSVASIGIGALSMVGSKAFGATSLIEGIIRFTHLFESESARKWAAPAVGVVIAGTLTYFILELPNTIPRTVGRHIRASLKPTDGDERPETTFVEKNAERISRETRKVLRLASYDLRERFRNAMDTNGREVQSAEEVVKKAGRAVEYFRGVQVKTAELRESAMLLEA